MVECGARRDVTLKQRPARRKSKNGDLMRKTAPLPGFLRAEHIRCGKPACRCTHGQLHGPYWYRRWREDRRQRRQYVRPAEVARVRAALEAWFRLIDKMEA